MDPRTLPADALAARAQRRAWRRTWRRARRTAAASRGSVRGYLTGSLALKPSSRRHFFAERLARRSGRRLLAASGAEVCATYATVIVWDAQSQVRSGIAGPMYSQVMSLMHDDPHRFENLKAAIDALNALRARERARRSLQLDAATPLVAALAYHVVTTPGFAQVWLAQQHRAVLADHDHVIDQGQVGRSHERDCAELVARDAQSLAVLALRRRAEESAVWPAVVAISEANSLDIEALLETALAANA